MNKADVNQAVAAWLPLLGVQPAAPGVKDLIGRAIRVAKFTDEETVRFFFPRRSLVFQQRMVKALAVQLRNRGGRIESVPLTVGDYARWLEARGGTDTPDLRYRFASAPPPAA